MGISAKPFGKMQSVMRKIENVNAAQEYAARHATDKKKSENKQESEA